MSAPPSLAVHAAPLTSVGPGIRPGIRPGAAEPSSMRPAEAQSRAAIARAAASTGIDFDYLLAQAKLESSLDPSARARTSSASGLYQFIDNTWLETMDRHGARLGFADVADAIETRGGRARVTTGAQRNAILSMRFDPQAAALMAGALASDNRAHLANTLGRDPEPAELYLAHFLGANGAEDFLTALQRNPDAAAAPLMPKAARANRAIFYQGGTPRSLQGVMELFERKMAGAMEDRGPPGAVSPQTFASIAPAAAYSPSTPAAQSDYRHSRRGSLPALPSLPSPQQRLSMAETLRQSFGASETMPGEHVQRAYGKLKALGL